MKNLKFLYVLILGLLYGCSSDGSLSAHEDSAYESFKVSTEQDQAHEGMVRVLAKNTTYYVGTDEETAKANEKPKMKVKFGYDFSIGIHEVTCREMGEDFCSKDTEDYANLPVVYVTYFDAVLYANKRSVEEGLDTAYTYGKASYDEEGRCIGLSDLKFKPDVNAYRLPTEAEWMLVSSGSWNPAKSWNSSNSEFKRHPVCSADTSGMPVCDMAGNVSEWVNDWLGYFADTVMTNFAGALNEGSVGERVLKGGSFRNGEKNLFRYSRGDIYTVVSSMKAEYVGFRLAFGSIPKASFLSGKNTASPGNYNMVASLTDLRQATGTYQTKFAFRDDVTGNLVFVDGHSGNYDFVVIEDSIEVYHPEISPDGKRVAFCSKQEGVAGVSKLFVRDLNASGSNLVQLDVESAAIPRWRILDNGDTVIVYVSDAGVNSEESRWMEKSTWQVKFSGGKFGKTQKLFDGSFHGGVSEDGSLAVTGARLLRARLMESSMQTGENLVWYGEEQACNVSLSRDGSKRTLFLDFGGRTGHQFVGESYRTHQNLLVVDSTGDLVQHVAAPAGYSFDHTEWAVGSESAGGENLVVATLTNGNGAHTTIVLVDMDSEKVIPLVEGDELWHPSLWVKSVNKSANGISLDSAGEYLTEFHDSEQALYRHKLGLFWKNFDETEILLVGSSRTEWGLNPDLYPERKMLNVGVSGIDIGRDLYFIKNYGLNHGKNLKAIVLSVDLDGWRGYEDHLELVMVAGSGYTYDANHGFWADSIPEGFLQAVEDGLPADDFVTKDYTEAGGRCRESVSWTSAPIEVVFDSVFTPSQEKYLDGKLKELKEVVEMASKRDIYVIGIVFPQAPQYKNTGSFGVYGLQRSVAKKKLQWLDSLAKENSHFVLMDEYKMGDHDYPDYMALNRDHLSCEGAEQVTNRLVDKLDSLMK
ncbi:MAG: TIGR02171 family protein [Fibrobacter sp.]|nr:TIGR02171 family protein [Fibrobacter sp.]